MKVNLRTIINATPTWSRIVNYQSDKLPVRLAYKIATVQTALAPILERFEKCRVEALRKYATIKEAEQGGQNFTFTNEDGSYNVEGFTQYEKELNDLLAVEEEVFVTVSLAELEKLELNPSLSAGEITTLLWLLDEKS